MSESGLSFSCGPNNGPGPEVVGSNPTPATTSNELQKLLTGIFRRGNRIATGFVKARHTHATFVLGKLPKPRPASLPQIP
jgi:hypothetical protein